MIPVFDLVHSFQVAHNFNQLLDVLFTKAVLGDSLGSILLLDANAYIARLSDIE